MTIAPEPLLRPVDLAELRPTQMTVGYREVARRRAEWRGHARHDGSAFLGRHMIPVVIGPRHRPHLIDNHHLARALHEEGVDHVLVHVVADLSGLKRGAFLTVMDNRNWLHPFDEKGKRCGYRWLPKHIGDLADDPYRSLAGSLRRAAGFAKVDMLYAEFLWADYLRRAIPPERLAGNYEGALNEALQLARSGNAAYLPGWAGPSDRD